MKEGVVLRILKSVVPVTLLAIALLGFSGCHGSGSGLLKARWVNEADSNKVLELTLRVPNVMGRMHMAVFGGRVRGTFILKDSDKTLEGVVTQVDDSYRLTANDGKEQKFEVDRNTGALKDEAGAVWKADKPPATATLKEW
jgi:hypothetical protein